MWRSFYRHEDRTHENYEKLNRIVGLLLQYGVDPNVTCDIRDLEPARHEAISERMNKAFVSEEGEMVKLSLPRIL